MQVMDFARAGTVQDNLTTINRRLNLLSEDVVEIIAQLKQYSGLEEAVRTLGLVRNSIFDEAEVARQMKNALEQSIARYQSCEMNLADNVEEARAVTGTPTEATEWNTPDWALTLLH